VKVIIKDAKITIDGRDFSDCLAPAPFPQPWQGDILVETNRALREGLLRRAMAEPYPVVDFGALPPGRGLLEFVRLREPDLRVQFCPVLASARVLVARLVCACGQKVEVFDDAVTTCGCGTTFALRPGVTGTILHIASPASPEVTITTEMRWQP
jgi:hypothetical protein